MATYVPDGLPSPQDVTRQGLIAFFEQLVDRAMADRVHGAQFDHRVGQQAQGPAGGARWRVTAGHYRHLGVDVARERRRCAGPALVIRRRLQSAREKTPPHIDHRAFPAHDRIGNVLVGARLALAAVAQQQDPRAGMGTGRSVAGAN